MSKRSKNTYIKINSNSNRNNNKIINIKTIYNQNIKSLRKDLNKASNKASSKSISKLLRITLCNSNKFCCHCNNKNTLSIQSIIKINFRIIRIIIYIISSTNITFRFINCQKYKVNYEDTHINSSTILTYIEYTIEYIIAYIIIYTIGKLKVNSNQIFYYY